MTSTDLTSLLGQDRGLNGSGDGSGYGYGSGSSFDDGNGSGYGYGGGNLWGGGCGRCRTNSNDGDSITREAISTASHAAPKQRSAQSRT